MTKDEMKNRISMALKDPVLQQGFEIICKENAELKKKIGIYQKGMYDEIEKRDRKLTKAKELLKWALHSDPEHDSLVDFDTKWKEAEQFIKEIEK